MLVTVNNAVPVCCGGRELAWELSWDSSSLIAQARPACVARGDGGGAGGGTRGHQATGAGEGGQAALQANTLLTGTYEAREV